MPGVNLDNVRAAEVQPMVGTEGRTQVTPYDVGGILSNVAGAFDLLKKAGEDKSEQKAALAIVDESIRQQEGTTFQANPPENVAGQKAGQVESETGIKLDAGDKAALSQAASIGTRLNDAQTAQPTGERRFNLLRTKELRKLIADRPHLAREFRSLIYGDNNFITASMDTTDAQAAAEAKARHESISKVRDMLVLAGNPEVANMDDNGVLDFYAKSGYANDIRVLEDVRREAATYKALYEKGTAINAEDTRRMVLTGKPGMVRTTMTQLDAIMTNPVLDVASKQRAIETVILNRRQEIATAMPWLSATEIEAQFKDVLKDIPDTYRMLASEGPEKAAAETRLAIVKANIDLGLEEKYGKSTVEFASRVISNLQATGVLSNYDTVRDSMPVQKFLGALAAGQNGDNTAANVRLTKRDERQVAEEQQQENQFIQRMLGGFDKLDEDSRRATAVMVVNSINHPDNKRTPAGMDRLMALMASPQFKDLAQSAEWQDTVDDSADRAIGNYLRHLDDSVGATLGPLEGKVTVKLDNEGVLIFQPEPGLDGKDRDKLARLQNRLRNAIFANANLHGQTPAEATRDFYETYLAQ